jgi:hypothetical protein
MHQRLPQYLPSSARNQTRDLRRPERLTSRRLPIHIYLRRTLGRSVQGKSRLLKSPLRRELLPNE